MPFSDERSTAMRSQRGKSEASAASGTSGASGAKNAKTVVIPDLHRVASALSLRQACENTSQDISRELRNISTPRSGLLQHPQPRKTDFAHIDKPAAMLGVFGGGEMTARAFPEKLVAASDRSRIQTSSKVFK